MSDFFASLTQGNVRFTDARINGDGPLPTTLSGPAGVHGDADGKYNFNDNLLSGIIPYAMPGNGRMGSDRNYQQIPHRKQFPVPPIYLPEPAVESEKSFMVSHAIDMGDLVFIVNLRNKHNLLTDVTTMCLTVRHDQTGGVMPQYNVFCNICTANYLLAGMYNYIIMYLYEYPSLSQRGGGLAKHHWWQLIENFGISGEVDSIRQLYPSETSLDNNKPVVLLKIKAMLQQVVRNNIVPIGISVMSEKQGGQHEVGLGPVQAAASFFTTLTIDGQNRDLINIWRHVSVEGGDHLILRLDFDETKRDHWNYTVNHYYKQMHTRSIQLNKRAGGRFQLVPDVFQSAHPAHINCCLLPMTNIRDTSNHRAGELSHTKIEEWTNTLVQDWLDKHTGIRHGTAKLSDREKSQFKNMIEPTRLQLRDALCQYLDYKVARFWHIGQTYTKKAAFESEMCPIDDRVMTDASQLLQINFAPVYKHGLQPTLGLPLFEFAIPALPGSAAPPEVKKLLSFHKWAEQDFKMTATTGLNDNIQQRMLALALNASDTSIFHQFFNTWHQVNVVVRQSQVIERFPTGLEDIFKIFGRVHVSRSGTLQCRRTGILSKQ